MKGHSYITMLASRGEFFFTTSDMEAVSDISASAARAALRRLKYKGEIATPYPQFHLIIPPEYRAAGCLPPEHFISDLMNYLKLPYYVGLLSAGQFYGAAHQKPQVFQVVTTDNRSSIVCGRVHIEFVARKNTHILPVQEFKTSKGYLRVSTPEVTALDVVNYPLRSGGLNNAVTVLQELEEKIDLTRLSKLVTLIKTTSQLQRLGFLLDITGQEKFAQVVEQELKKRTLYPVPLVSYLKKTSVLSERNSRWKIIINAEWESDL